MMRFWNKASHEPWAISSSALSTILEIASRQNETPETVAAKLGKQLDNTYSVTERDGVAIIPVAGPLFRYTNFWTLWSGATSYERIAHDFHQIVDDPKINSVIFDFDSPGGEVNGCAELASLIFDSRGKKPIIAYASGDCASGAYWIASACDRIVTSETAQLGSIGVVAVYRNSQRERDDEIEIVSSQSPFKRLDPSEDAGRDKIQTRIDALADVFINAIAKHRNRSPDVVKSEYGQGDVFIGQTAVERGLADSGGTFEKLITQLSTTTKNPASPVFFMSEEKPMDIDTLKADHPLVYQHVFDEGSKKERARIGAILGAEEATHRQALAQHLAFNSDLAPEAIQVALLQAPENKPTPLSPTTPTSPIKGTTAQETNTKQKPDVASGFVDVMASLGNPDIQTGGDNDSSEEESGEQIAARIAAYSNRNPPKEMS